MDNVTGLQSTEKHTIVSKITKMLLEGQKGAETDNFETIDSLVYMGIIYICRMHQ